MMTALSRTTATIDGPAWSAGAFGWIEYWAGFAAPAREAVALVGKTDESRAEPYRRPDGSYRFENRFRYVIAMAP